MSESSTNIRIYNRSSTECVCFCLLVYLDYPSDVKSQTGHTPQPANVRQFCSICCETIEDIHVSIDECAAFSTH